MKIAIVCGSLQPGHDGVGDYTRRLAGEIMKQGHVVTAVALNDRHIKSTIEEVQDADGVELKVLRIASAVEDKQRYVLLKGYLLKFKPNWVSLQFVPYSFHIKGIPFKLFGQLAALKLQVKWHILFHEIWLDKTERMSQSIVRLLQIASIYAGIKKLNPDVVNTTIPYNQRRLQNAGLRSSVLGLFGNITYTEAKQALTQSIVHNANNILYFGGPPRNEYLKQVMAGLEQFCKDSERPVNIIVVSGYSAAKDAFVNILNEKLFVYGVHIKDMGFVETPLLSNLLSNCSVGIVRSEPYFLGKSGSAVAMLEHGLPVWLPKWVTNEPVDYTFRKHLIHANLQAAASQLHEGYQGLLLQIAQNFINQLSNN